MLVEPFIDSITHFNSHCRVDKVGCSYLYRCSTSHHELYRITSIHNTAKADNRYLNGFSYLPHHTQGNWFDSRSAKSSSINTQHSATLLYINSHSHQSVDQRYTVGTLSLTGKGDISNIRHVGRKLYYQRLVITLTDSPYYAFCTGTGDTESHTPIFYVRTRNIQLDGWYLV